MSENFLTIISIAKELGLPESTVRFYRDKFLEYIPFEGEGRKRRYRPEAVRVLGFIARSLRSGKTSKKTAEELLCNFPRYMTRYINSTDETTELKTSIVLSESQPNQLAFYEQKLASYEKNTQILVELVKSLSREVISLKEENINNINDQKQKELLHRVQFLETEKFSLFADKKKLSDFQKELNKLKRPFWKKVLGVA